MCPADSSPTRAICYTFPKKGNDTPLTFQMASRWLEDLTQRPATVPKGREETEDDAYDDSAWIECL